MMRAIWRGILLLALALPVLAGCAAAAPATNRAPNRATPSATAAPSASPAPRTYTAHVLLQGSVRPDDLAFDAQGRLLFSDFYAGTVSRLNADGSVSVLLRGLPGPEGLVGLAGGTLIVAEQRTNQIVKVAPGSTAPTLLRTLPGTLIAGSDCKDGVDGIALDPATQTLIVPDSPTGTVYRMSLDGSRLTPLASGIARPVGALVDAQGTVYIADECGGAIWRIPPSGAIGRIGGFGRPDDLAFDTAGNLLLIDLASPVHALIRIDARTGERTTLARAGLVEPQGLAVDARGDIFVSDDAANRIVEYTPVG